MPPRLLPLLLIVTAIWGCSHHLPDSLGPARKLIVIADAEDWKTLEEPLQKIFETVIYTPQAEHLYEVERGDVRFFYEYKHALRKNLMVIAPIDAEHPTAQFLREILSPEVQQTVREGKIGVFTKRDVWAKDQMLMVVTGKTLSDVVDNLRMSADSLYSTLRQSVDKSVKDRVYSFGERKQVTKELADNYGWSVHVPFGYRILAAYPDSGFVVLAHDNPNRWLWVYWENDVSPDQITDDWCIQKRNEITGRLFGGDRIVPSDVTIRHDVFAGKIAVVLQGVWENEKEWKGGPFKSYAFFDADQNRFFYLDIGMFAPNKRKVPYLRQVDLVAQTFEINRK